MNKIRKSHSLSYYYILFVNILFSIKIVSQPLMENLDRGVVAVKNGEDVFISWRLLGFELEDVGFNIYRIKSDKKHKKLNRKPVYDRTNYIDKDVQDISSVQYFIIPVIKNKEVDASEPVSVWEDNYITVPLKTPDRYRPGDASVADLDDDGQYEIVVHMSRRGLDNGRGGVTTKPILHAYELDGTFLWEIDLGRNIREGAHYTQFLVYDLDGDGKAEVTCKTADGTVDGKGNIIGNEDSVYVEPRGSLVNEINRKGDSVEVNVTGYILSGPEYLTVFNGETGEALSTVDYIPPRHPETLHPTAMQLKELWGDGHGNRIDRFLACVAYLDGQLPSVVMCRGYYARSTLTAWNFRDGKLEHIWTFDSDDGTPGNRDYRGQGNHNLSVGDVDNDGKDEIIYGACVIDDDGKGLYSTGFGHGDAMHFSDLDPENPGLEVFNIQERFDDAGMNFREAGTGKVLWKVPSVKAAEEGGDKGEGPGRGCSFNIDPRYPGNECWVRGADIHGVYNAKGEKISEKEPRSVNFGIWWDGDLLRELLDRNYIGKWDWDSSRIDTILNAVGAWSINGSKATPVLSADLFGDWREEVIWRTKDKNLRIYTTTIPTEHRFYTLMHDPTYRLGIAWQNIAYNQPPHTGFYMGDEMKKQLKPNIRIIRSEE